MCKCEPVYCEFDNVTYPSCMFSCEEDLEITGWYLEEKEEKKDLSHLYTKNDEYDDLPF